MNIAVKHLPQKIHKDSLLFALLAIGAGGLVSLLVATVSNDLYLVAITTGLVAIVLMMARAEWGLLFLVFATYTRMTDVVVKYHGVPSLTKPLIALLVAIILFRWIAHKERPAGWERPALLVAGYGFIGFISLLYASNETRTLAALEDFAKDGAIIVMVAILLQNAATLRRVIWALLGAGIFLGTISVYQQLTGTFGNEYWGFGQSSLQHIVGDVNNYRVGGPFGSPNAYAQILLPLLPLALNRLWNERNFLLRLAAVWALSVCILTIIFTFSRNGFLSMALTLGLMMLLRPPRLPVLLATAAIVIPLIQFIPAQYTERILTIQALVPGIGDPDIAARQEISFRGRLSESRAGWMMFADQPVLGVGLANFPERYQEYSRQLGIDPRREERGAHNLYMQIAAEQGLLGLAAFGLLMAAFFYGLWRAKQDFLAAGMPEYAGIVVAFAIGLIGYLTASTFIHMAYPRFFWLLIGIGLALPGAARHELTTVRGNRR